ncbi:TonB-dependent receptor [Sphingomonas crusticola]|uniref:TonB-dependent receptor n=1 Tax=Sphingomonas crusticola TaxID=1697973 RepID=UPI0013C305BE|nr:TonB-dependent receptor [Sphingomonas crusticola]
MSCRTLLLAACAAGAAMPSAALATSPTFDVPARDLGGALMALARQANREIHFSADLTRPFTAPALQGELTVDEALTRLLAGTGLAYHINGSGAIVIEHPSGGADAGGAAAENESAEVVVTGTNIRGIVPRSSPLTIVDRRELDARGATTAEQAVNTFTQNFNSVSGNTTSADRAGFFNQTGTNGVDLRGLGPGTTLVLLNGRRLSGSANGRAVDISQIPLTAVSRVELLTDSASSVYGSDAVGGVVNFILLDHFDGLEARAGYGTTDDGAQGEYRGSLTGGLNWSTGNAVISASYLDRSALTADERSFSRDVEGAYTLVQPQKRTGLFLTARQEAGDDLTFNVDGLYNRRTGFFSLFRDLGLSGGVPRLLLTEYHQVSNSWFGSLGATWRVSDALTIDTIGSYSRIKEGALSDDVMSTVTSPVTQHNGSLSQAWDATTRASGRLFALPGGNLAYSFGVGVTRETLSTSRIASNTDGYESSVLDDHKRTTRYAFGELNLPFIGPATGLPGINQLEANISARYSDYSDFGKNFSPKIGVLWSITPGFNLRSSYGRTFRAPYLDDIGRPGVYSILDLAGFGLHTPDPAGDPIGLYIDDGVDPKLGPETSNLLTFGMDLRPPSVPRLNFSFTYVSIDYKNRIARGDPGRGTYYFQPQLFRELFNFSPTKADIASILGNATLGIGNNVTSFDLTNLDALAANVGYILDNRLRNISKSSQKAVDINASYAFKRGTIDYSIGANATYILASETRTTPSSQVIAQSNILGRPVDFRGNAFVGLATGGYSARLTGNYVGAYLNPYVPAYPKISDQLTFDLTASYDFGERPGPLHGLAIYLTVQNLLNRDPPFAADLGAGVTDGLSEPIGYDPSNANPLRRYLSIELRKRF